MKRYLAAIIVTTWADLAGQAPATGIQRAAWLQGCWADTTAARTIEEQWMAPRGNAMVAMGRTVRDGRLIESEHVVLREENGRLAYEAHPSGQPPAVFPLKAVTDSTLEFENPQHDFPQRVGYQRQGADALLAWIEGTAGGRTRRVEFQYRRVACPAAP